MFIAVDTSRPRERYQKRDTAKHTWVNLDGGNTQAAGLEDEADAAGDHALPDATDDTARNQDVLHGGDLI
jgi:hypothetical protein